MPSRGVAKSYRMYWLAALAVLLPIGGDVAAHLIFGQSLVAKYVFGPGAGERPDVITHIVKKQILNVTVTEKGQLESADNRDIVCKVRAGSKGYATTITWVIEDGTRVKPGQLIMLLEDSTLRDQEENQNVLVKQAMAAKVKAEKDYEIAINENANVIALAEIDLDKLTGLVPGPNRMPLAAVVGIPGCLLENGSYRQDLDDITGQISKAQSDVDQNGDRSKWADRMVAQKYMSSAQAQAERARYDGSVESLRSLQAKKSLLISHDRNKLLTDLTSKWKAAKLKAEAQEIQFRIDRQTKTSIFEQQSENLDDIRRQRTECKVHAPEDIEDGSMVVYFKPDGNRFGSSSSQGLIEQGAQVKEGQKMLRIPNLSKMQVNTKIHEAMVSRVRGEVRVPTKIAEGMQFALLNNLDPLGRMLATRPPILEDLRERYRKYEYRKVAEGQRATIRLNSIALRQFVGHVKTVAAVASQADMFMSDVKLYQAYVRIDSELVTQNGVQTEIPLEPELLKPDLTAEVTISVDAAKGPVLTAPIQAIIGGAEMGASREVFVKTATGYERRSITLGLYNETMVEIRSGLNEGDEIVSNPKVLLGDKDKTKTRDTSDSKGNPDSKGGEKDAMKGGDPSKKGDGKKPGGGPGGPGAGGPGGGGFPKGN